MTPLDGPAKPRPKSAQLARGERKHYRKVASPKRWQAIIDAKRGPCRVCERPAAAVQFHHLIPRAHGGSDTENNITPLCLACHGLVEQRDRPACRLLAESLTDGEYSYVVETFGEGFFERRLGIVYERAT